MYFFVRSPRYGKFNIYNIVHFFFFVILLLKLRKIKINDLNEKCNLLEQSLRVIAQENHDLEKIKNFNSLIDQFSIQDEQQQEIKQKMLNNNSPVVNIPSSSTNSDDENFYDIGTLAQSIVNFNNSKFILLFFQMSLLIILYQTQLIINVVRIN